MLNFLESCSIWKHYYYFLCILKVQYHELNSVQCTKANNIYCTHIFYHFQTLSTDTGSLVLRKKIYVGYVFSVHSFRKKFPFYSTFCSFCIYLNFNYPFPLPIIDVRRKTRYKILHADCRLQINYKILHADCRLQINYEIFMQVTYF